MKVETPKKIATVGGILLSVSGVVNAVLGARIGALFYDAYPGGRMGHVGVIAGLLAIVIGVIMVFFVVPLYERRNRWVLALAGILTIVLGHAGAVAGAIYVGTAGVALCYVAGIWLLIVAVRGIPNG
ncbi:MAG: hypothetical protein JSW46_08940 [Gemmatimonadota bacterium]|nr:MAG: hypothetical protein JSW46_08940 [Gemmatimonadota bacterium]